jgi:hypothetical protein
MTLKSENPPPVAILDIALVFARIGIGSCCPAPRSPMGRSTLSPDALSARRKAA